MHKSIFFNVVKWEKKNNGYTFFNTKCHLRGLLSGN